MTFSFYKRIGVLWAASQVKRKRGAEPLFTYLAILESALGTSASAIIAAVVAAIIPAVFMVAIAAPFAAFAIFMSAVT